MSRDEEEQTGEDHLGDDGGRVADRLGHRAVAPAPRLVPVPHLNTHHPHFPHFPH